MYHDKRFCLYIFLIIAIRKVGSYMSFWSLLLVIYTILNLYCFILSK